MYISAHISSALKLTDLRSALLMMDHRVAKLCISVSSCVEVLDFTDLGEKCDVSSPIEFNAPSNSQRSDQGRQCIELKVSDTQPP